MDGYPGHESPSWRRGNRFSEAWFFRAAWWRDHFVASGFDVVAEMPAGLFYTGSCLLAGRLAIPARTRLARVLGSSSRIFMIRPSARNASRQ